MVPIILLERLCPIFRNLIVTLLASSLILVSSSFAAAPFSFSIGDRVGITSDKGLRHGALQRYEAFGNVVITHYDETLYGASANYDMITGQIDVSGNTRYVGPKMTLYGQKLSFNIKSGLLTVRNARILTDGYVVVGEYVARIANDVVIAENAEYSTCHDCPESWSVYGKRVKLILNNYIHIQHAIIKINGVSLMYLPYVVLPIKRNRQTGLLFPQFSMSFKEGFKYRQPWFWAINDSSDLQLTPFSDGKRGLGDELVYRHILGDKKWFNISSIHNVDRIYAPNKNNDDISGTHTKRHLSEYEHHYQFTNRLNHHFYLLDASDLDMYRDFHPYSTTKLSGPQAGLETYLDWTTLYSNIGVETYINRNLLVPYHKGYDNSYVNMLPTLTFSTVPFNMVHSDWPLLQNISLNVDSDISYFKQNHVQENNYIRNAQRINLFPSLNWDIGQIGPVHFKSNLTWEGQYYRFPFKREGESDFFAKDGFQIVSQASFEIEKIIGMSFQETVPFERIMPEDLEKWKEKQELLKKKNKKIKQDPSVDNWEELGISEDLIGNLPSYEESYIEDSMKITGRSYRHSMVFNFRHRYLSDQKTRGNQRFAQQIKNPAGLFDYTDIPREIRSDIGSLATQTGMPESNTLEIEILNSLIRKAPRNYNAFEDETYLRNNFKYDKIAYFDISQGIFIKPDEKATLEEKLTRLYMTTGFSLGRWGLGASEYYFWGTKKHIFTTHVSRSFDTVGISVGMTYDQLQEPSVYTLDFGLSIRPFSQLSLGILYNYDYTQKKYTHIKYDLLYSPPNNCWKTSIGYFRDLKDQGVIFNFLVNFGDGIYTSILTPSQSIGAQSAY